VLTNYLSMAETQGPDTHRLVQKPSQAVQKGRPARPQQATGDCHLSGRWLSPPDSGTGTGQCRSQSPEPPSAARTPLADFVNSLLVYLSKNKRGKYVWRAPEFRPTSALVFGKDVTNQTHSKDKYRRTPANVLLPDGANVNHTHWSKTAGVGGIGSMHPGTQYLKN
jgi:hypothetical protein